MRGQNYNVGLAGLGSGTCTFRKGLLRLEMNVKNALSEVKKAMVLLNLLALRNPNETMNMRSKKMVLGQDRPKTQLERPKHLYNVKIFQHPGQFRGGRISCKSNR